MKTQMNSTSLDAYHSLPVAGYLQPKEQKIMSEFTGEHVVLTRKELAERTKMDLSGVCGRVNSLIAKGVLIARGHRKDPITRKTQELLGLPVQAQGSLFGKVA